MIRKVFYLIAVSAVAIGVAFVLGRLPARADDADSNDTPVGTFAGDCPIAVIDVALIFKNYGTFLEGMAELKQKVVQKGQELETQKQQVLDLLDQLAKLDKKSEEYLELEVEIASRQSSLKLWGTRAKKELAILEAKLYAAAYKELQDAVEKHAKSRGIRLVVRRNGSPIVSDEPESVMKGVNRTVVFQDGIDITAEIIRRLNDKDVS